MASGFGSKVRGRGAPGPAPARTGPLAAYLSEIGRRPLLDAQQEQELARRFRDLDDLDAGHRLVTANLRFVVKVAYGYRSYGLPMADLVQEGNVGLMHAVRKFDPDRRIRLISYGVWWIKAYIQNYVLHNWSLVRIGTTQSQRKLFFSLARTRRELEKLGGARAAVGEEDVARKLRVKPGEVVEMQNRLSGRDLSLDAPIGDDGASTHLDHLDGGSLQADDDLGRREEDAIARRVVAAALSTLDERERFIVERRLMAEKPETLRDLGARFGFSRERARQLEGRARRKLRLVLGDAMPDRAGPEPLLV